MHQKKKEKSLFIMDNSKNFEIKKNSLFDFKFFSQKIRGAKRAYKNCVKKSWICWQIKLV
jgi:hypothetical protein